MFFHAGSAVAVHPESLAGGVLDAMVACVKAWIGRLRPWRDEGERIMSHPKEILSRSRQVRVDNPESIPRAVPLAVRLRETAVVSVTGMGYGLGFAVVAPSLATGDVTVGMVAAGLGVFVVAWVSIRILRLMVVSIVRSRRGACPRSGQRSA